MELAVGCWATEVSGATRQKKAKQVAAAGEWGWRRFGCMAVPPKKKKSWNGSHRLLADSGCTARDNTNREHVRQGSPDEREGAYRFASAPGAAHALGTSREAGLLDRRRK